PRPPRRSPQPGRRGREALGPTGPKRGPLHVAKGRHSATQPTSRATARGANSRCIGLRLMSGGEALEAEDLSGYLIHATDGEVGKVDHDDIGTGEGYLLIATGPWILGRTVLVPATVIDHIDHRNQTVYLKCRRGTIKSAPEYHEDRSHRAELDVWYG